jgi:hypothetical protein
MRHHQGDLEVDRTIGVRQGSREGPVNFFFIMQAAMEALQWPGGVARPEFMTRESGVVMGDNSKRKRDATTYELWDSFFCRRLRAPLQLASRTHHGLQPNLFLAF